MLKSSHKPNCPNFLLSILFFALIFVTGCDGTTGSSGNFQGQSVNIYTAASYSLESISSALSSNENVFTSSFDTSYSPVIVKVTSVAEGTGVLSVKGTGTSSEGVAFRILVLYNVSVASDGGIKTQLLAESREEGLVITLDSNGGSGYMGIVSGMQGELVTLPTNTFLNDDYTFTWWNTASDGSGIDYSDCASIWLTESMTLYAQWSAVPQTGGFVDGTSYSSTAEVATAIQNLTSGEKATIALGNTTSENDLSAIANALTNKDSCQITLDMSNCVSLTTIPADFSNKQAITKVIVPTTVTEIANNAFYNCNHLSEVVFASGSQLEIIGENAFCQTALTSIVFPWQLTRIGNAAFLNSNLSSATFSYYLTWTITGAAGRNENYNVVSDSEQNASYLRDSAKYSGEWTRN